MTLPEICYEQNSGQGSETHLREATRYKLDCGESYEELFCSVRKVEQEFLAQHPRKPVVKQEIKARDQAGNQNLLKQIASGIEEVKDMADLSRWVGKLESSHSEIPTKQLSQKEASSPRIGTSNQSVWLNFICMGNL